MKTTASATTTLDGVTWPDALDLHGRATVALTTLARAVADDVHEGDDAFGPRHLLVSALSTVDVDELRTLVGKAGGALVLTPEIARGLVGTTDDDLMCLGAWAWGDADHGARGWPCSARGPLCAEHAALVLVVGVVLHTRADVRRRAIVHENYRTEMHEGDEVTTYKLRAECLHDVLSLKTALGAAIASYAIRSDNCTFPDCTLELSTRVPAETLRKVIASIPDAHVMLETLQPIDRYTGERVGRTAS